MRRTFVGLIAAVLAILLIAAAVYFRNSGRTVAQTQNSGGAHAGKVVPAASASPPDDGNWTMPAKDYAATTVQRTQPNHAGERRQTAGRLHLLDRRRPRGSRRRRWSSTARCTWSRLGRTTSSRSTSPSPAHRRNGYTSPTRGRGRERRRLLRAGQPRRGSIGTGKIYLQPARRQHGRRRRRDAARKCGGPSSATSRRARPSPWRRWSPTAKCWSAIRAARWASAAGSPRSTQAAASSSWKAYSTGPDKDVLIGPRLSTPSTPRTRAATSGSRPGRPDTWKIGGGTVWGWISYDPALKTHLLRHLATPARGTRTSAPATTNGRPECSRATSAPARRAGSIRARRTIFTTTTTSTRSCWSTIRSATGSAFQRSSGRAATASSTSRTAATARCSRPSPTATSTSTRASI